MLGPLMCVLMAQTAEGTVTITPKLDLGPRLVGPCEVHALHAGPPVRGTSSVSVSPGQYRLLFFCSDVRQKSVPILGPTVAALQDINPSIPLRIAPIRIELRRNGTGVRGSVQLNSGNDELGPLAPRLQVPSGSTIWVGRSAWTMTAEVENPAVVAAIPTPRWKPGRKVTVVKADLSDGMARFEAQLHHQKVQATVTAHLLPNKELSQTFVTGESKALVPGSYRFEIKLKDALDFSTKVLEAEVLPNRTLSRTFQFSGGWVEFRVRRLKQKVEAPIQIYRAGAANSINFIQAWKQALLQPGQYRAAVQGADLDLGEFQIFNGKKRIIEADISPGLLKVQLKGTARTVQLQEAGAGRIINAAFSDFVEVPPGRYEVVAEFSDGSFWTSNAFGVKKGQKLHPEITVPAGTLAVQAYSGGRRLKRYEVFVFKEGAGAPILKLNGPSKVFLPVGGYDLMVRYGSSEVWKRGVELQSGQELLSSLTLTPQSDLPDGDFDDDDLPEGDFSEE